MGLDNAGTQCEMVFTWLNWAKTCEGRPFVIYPRLNPAHSLPTGKTSRIKILAGTRTPWMNAESIIINIYIPFFLVQTPYPDFFSVQQQLLARHLPLLIHLFPQDSVVQTKENNRHLTKSSPIFIHYCLLCFPSVCTNIFHDCMYIFVFFNFWWFLPNSLLCQAIAITRLSLYNILSYSSC